MTKTEQMELEFDKVFAPLYATMRKPDPISDRFPSVPRMEDIRREWAETFGGDITCTQAPSPSAE
jgi:hypothetical protein